MNISLDMSDFGSLWHTACKGLTLEKSRFEYMKGKKLSNLPPIYDNYFYWLGDNDLQAIAALQLLNQSGHTAGQFRDTAPINDDPDDYTPWGYVLITNLSYEKNEKVGEFT